MLFNSNLPYWQRKMGEDGVVWINQPVISGNVFVDRNQNGNQDTVFNHTQTLMKKEITSKCTGLLNVLTISIQSSVVQVDCSPHCKKQLHSFSAKQQFRFEAPQPDGNQGRASVRNGCLISNGTALFRKHACFGHCLVLIHHCQNCQKSEQDTIGLPNPNPTHFVAGLVGWKVKEIRWLPKPLQLPRSL